MTTNYYHKHKEKPQNDARERYQNLSEEEKYKRRKKARERYQNFTEEEKEKKRNKNLSEEQKNKLAEYRRNYYLTHREQLLRDFVDFLKILGQQNTLNFLIRYFGNYYFFLVMLYEKILNFLFYGLVIKMLKNSKNVGNFCGDEKFFVIKFFF